MRTANGAMIHSMIGIWAENSIALSLVNRVLPGRCENSAAQWRSKVRSRRSLVIDRIFITLFALLLASAATRAEYVEAESAGTTLQIRFAGPIAQTRADEIVRWLQDVAADVGHVYGRFPIDNLGVVVIPHQSGARDTGSPVPFARVTRRGQETVEIYIDSDRPMSELYADWTLTHEFSHLMLPRIGWQQRWISEGFASYYQNVLMARAGHYSTRMALQKLSAGFERGRASQPRLSPNEAAREGIRTARYKIYWSGAAIALLADIALREQSRGEESLDVILGRFQQCCLPSRRRWSGQEFFEKLDSLAMKPVFMPLYRRYANAPGFPDIDGTLAKSIVRKEIFAVRTSPN